MTSIESSQFSVLSGPRPPFGFWSTPQWQAYLAAYGRPHDPHVGPNGNLIIRLGPDAEMWSRISHGHKAAIHKAERIADEITVVGPDGDLSLFDVFQRLHLLDAGRATRPQATWDLMRDWITEGCGLLVLARYDTQFMAAGYFLKWQGWSYYASSARHPDLHRSSPLMSGIIWRAMRELAGQGIEVLDMGPVPPPAAPEKERSLAAFKRHFGARNG